MQNLVSTSVHKEGLHGGHFGLIALTAVLLLGVSYIKNPASFNFTANSKVLSGANAPRYYAYVEPADNTPLVAGANTAQGPSIINEDGSLTPVDMGSVLGAATEGVQLSLDSIAVKQIPDSDDAIQQYFIDSLSIESGYIDNADFEAALMSGNQAQIDAQAQKLSDISNNLQQLSVPRSLVKLQKLKILQYEAGVGLLKNFTKADENPELVGQYLGQFLKAQQDMDNENQVVQQKYGADLGFSAAEDQFMLDSQTSAEENLIDPYVQE